MTFVDSASAKLVAGASSVTGESAATASGEVPAPALPEPAAAWTDATTAALAAIADFFRETRQGMREIKKAFDASRQQEMRNEVRSMREQADEIRSGAVVQAVTLAASAGLGAASLATSGKTSEGFKVAGDTAGRSQDVVKSVYDARAKDCEADGAGARANAERAKANGEDVREMSDAQAELASKAMDAIKAVLEARHAATMAVLSHRG